MYIESQNLLCILLIGTFDDQKLRFFKHRIYTNSIEKLIIFYKS